MNVDNIDETEIMEQETEIKEKKGASMFKNKTAIGVACIAVALAFSAGTFMLNKYVNGTITIVRAKVEITQGTQITPAMLESVSVGKINLPTDTITDPYAAIGKYATIEILPNDNMTFEKVSSENSAYSLEPGQMLISVPIKNLADGLSDNLQPGDIVSVFVPANSSNQQLATNGQSTASSNSSSQSQSDVSSSITPAICPKELQYVKVIDISTSSGTSYNQNENSSGGSQTTAATVTLIVNSRQSAILANLDSSSIHFALVSRGNAKTASNLLKAQDDILNSSN